MKTCAALALICLTACTDFPVLDDTLSDADRAAPFPELTNIAPLLAQANRGTQASAQDDANMRARINALQARAARLRRLTI